MGLKQLYSSSDSNQIYLLKSILESSNIETHIFDENISRMAPHYTFAGGGMRLMVAEQQFTEAQMILDDFIQTNKSENQPQKKVIYCKRCESKNVELQTTNNRLLAFIIVILGGILPQAIRSKQYYCKNCHYKWK